MVLYMGIWECTAVDGDILEYIVLYRGIWRCIGVCGDV